jgi:hypothetical protein
MFIFSFSIAVLAGMGVQSVIDAVSRRTETEHKNFNRLLFGVPILMFVLALLFTVAGRGMINSWTTLFHPEAFTGQVQAGVTRVEVGYMNLPAIQSGAWFGFLFSAAAAACLWLYRSRKTGIGILAVLLLLPVMDGCRFSQRFIDVFDPKGPFSTNPLVEYFKQQPGYFRVLNLSRVVPSTILPQFGVEVVIGYHGNQLRWYDELLGGPGAPNQVNPRFLNLVGAKYLLMPQGGRLPENFFGEKPIVEAANVGQIRIVRNDNAMPRVFLIDEYRVWDDHKAMVNEILSGKEDFSKTLFLESQPTLAIRADTVAGDSAWIVDHQLDSVLIGMTCSQNQLLVLMENDYDSWHAYVDGQPTPILRAYGSFRAVEVPAGTSKVLFKYKSERYATGRMITLLTLLYLLVIITFHLWKARRKRAQLEELA